MAAQAVLVGEAVLLGDSGREALGLFEGCKRSTASASADAWERSSCVSPSWREEAWDVSCETGEDKMLAFGRRGASGWGAVWPVLVSESSRMADSRIME